MRLLYSLMLIGFFLAGCGRAPQSPASLTPSSHPAQPPVTTLDDLGRAIKFQTSPRRIVAIGPGATEIIFALGAGDRLVGRDSASDYPAAALKVPVVGNFTGPFQEKTASVRPDFIIVQGETYDKTRADLWQQKCGAPVAVLAPESIRALWNGITKIGAWLDLPKQARDLNVSMAYDMNQGGGAHKEEDQLRAFIEVARSPLFTAGEGTLIDEVVRTADLNTIARDVQGYKQYNLESLIAKNPDIYIVTAQKPDKERVLKELRAHPVLRNLKCIQLGHVIVLPADLLLRPGPRLGKGILMLRRAADAIKYKHPAP